ncbi:MAG: hypothetical protein K0S99_146 [Thermomicrobiales bacterium]|jgi:hypothetical protein|nr:hypothetical protein [Thermomicrobiales bacterium]
MTEMSERERLGKVLHSVYVEVPQGAEWDGAPDNIKSAYRGMAEAVAAEVRGTMEARMAELERAIRDVIHEVWTLGGCIDTDMDARLRRLVAEPWPDGDDRDPVGGA